MSTLKARDERPGLPVLTMEEAGAGVFLFDDRFHRGQRGMRSGQGELLSFAVGAGLKFVSAAPEEFTGVVGAAVDVILGD